LDFSAYPASHKALRYAVSPALSIEHILSRVEKAVRVLLVEASEEDKLSGSSKVTYIHTYMPFHFINPSKPLGFGYETCPQGLTNTIRHTLVKTHTHTEFKI
jgi:hypothetical protein